MISKTMRDFMRAKYSEGATGPYEYDCGAFVRAVAIEVFSLNVPDFNGIEERCGDIGEDSKKIFDVLSGAGFSPVRDSPRAGDIVAISRFNNGFIDHVGIMIDEFQFVQMNRRGPEISYTSAVPYQRRIKGFYRCGT